MKNPYIKKQSQVNMDPADSVVLSGLLQGISSKVSDLAGTDQINIDVVAAAKALQAMFPAYTEQYFKKQKPITEIEKGPFWMSPEMSALTPYWGKQSMKLSIAKSILKASQNYEEYSGTLDKKRLLYYLETEKNSYRDLLATVKSDFQRTYVNHMIQKVEDIIDVVKSGRFDLEE